MHRTKKTTEYLSIAKIYCVLIEKNRILINLLKWLFYLIAT